MPRVIQRITKIIVHCSDSEHGDAALIHQWHLGRGWHGIGYHYVILNGRRDHLRPPSPIDDGRLEVGRRLGQTGAHCKGHNADSVGICLIGVADFTGRQMITLGNLLNDLMWLPAMNGAASVYGHRDFDPNKACPNIDTQTLRKMVS